MPNYCDQARLLRMGDCNLSVLYNTDHHKCEEKMCKYLYSSWCPTCDRNPPRRRRSRSETNETCKRKCREMKTFTPKKYNRNQEYENMEIDYNLDDLYYDNKEHRSECCHARSNLFELPTTYISNNGQVSPLLDRAQFVEKPSSDFVSSVQRNVKPFENNLKLVDNFDNQIDDIRVMSERSKCRFQNFNFTNDRITRSSYDFHQTKCKNELGSLKSPSRPLCVPVHNYPFKTKAKPNGYCDNGSFRTSTNGVIRNELEIPDSLTSGNQFLCPQHNQSYRANGKLNGVNHDRPNCISYDTSTFFDKKTDMVNLREKYIQEVEVLRQKLEKIKKNGQFHSKASLASTNKVKSDQDERSAQLVHNVHAQGDGLKATPLNGQLRSQIVRRKGILSPPLVKMRSKIILKTKGKSSGVLLRKIKSINSTEPSISSRTERESGDSSDEIIEESDIYEESDTVSTGDSISENDSKGTTSSTENGGLVSVAVTQPAEGAGLHSWPIRMSLFPNIPPYIQFSSYSLEEPTKLPFGRKHFKWKLSTITPVLVRKTLTNSGFVLVRKSNQWLGTWGKHMKSPGFNTLKSSQKLNHFPGTFQLGRKDRLWRNFQRMINKFGIKEFGFLPHTYILPQEIRLLKQNWESKNGAGSEMWIIKPPASARGVGIKVINKWSQLPKKQSLVVQKYISNPYLINDSKFDLRLYVLVTSFNPLRIYLYPEGLARFASSKYSEDAKDLKDRYMHLTNYSINKLSSQYTPNKDADSCQGHKWTITKLFEIMEERGINTKVLWKNLESLVIKTIITSEAPIISLCDENMNSRYNCYELFGIDVLLDEKLKPWLLEVNISPSLHSSSPLDTCVKGPMVQTLFDLAQFHLPAKLSQTSAEKVPPCYDSRLYTTALTKKEKRKHASVLEAETREQYLKDVLDNLTGDDVRHLTQAEDEFVVKGRFSRIFPTSQTSKYLGFLEPRYYNRLFDAWETKYENNRQAGVAVLRELCSQKVHLKVPPRDKSNKNLVIPGEVNQRPLISDQNCLLSTIMQEVTINPSHAV